MDRLVILETCNLFGFAYFRLSVYLTNEYGYIYLYVFFMIITSSCHDKVHWFVRFMHTFPTLLP